MTRIAADRFVAAVRRRWFVARLLETIGATVSAGAVGIAAWAAGCRWHPVPGWAAVVPAVVTAALFFRRWPTRAEAADRADERLGWDDLLGSVTRMESPAIDPAFAAAVAAAADAASAARTPSDVPVARWGRRAWAGVALACAASWVVTDLVAAASRPRPDDVAVALTSPDEVPAATETAGLVPPRTGSSADGTRIASVEPATGDDDPRRPTPAGGSSPTVGAAAGGDRGGRNGGNGRGPNATPDGARPSADDGTGERSKIGTAAQGGRSGPRAAGDETASSSAAGTGRSGEAVPPSHGGESAAARRATEALSDRSIPPARRAMVRDYFDPRP